MSIYVFLFTFFTSGEIVGIVTGILGAVLGVPATIVAIIAIIRMCVCFCRGKTTVTNTIHT